MGQRTACSRGLLASLLAMGLACNQSPGGSGLTHGETSNGGDAADDGAPPPADDNGGAGSDSGSTTLDPPKYDIGGIPDAPPPFGNCGGRSGGGGGGNDPLYSYIWIANSSEGTVSKIDTVSLVEVGRYRTHPDFGDPSRTSVSLNGDVAVANRNG